MSSKLRGFRNNFAIGVTEAILFVSFLAGSASFCARPLDHPSPSLCYAIAGVGVAIMLGYVIEAVWMVGRAKRLDWHDNWLGWICGAGICGLLGTSLALAVGAHREAGHGNLLDDLGLWWSVCSLALLGLLVTLHPFVVDRWERT